METAQCRVEDITPDELRKRAAHCRKLAQAVTGEGPRLLLLEMAEDYDARAAALDNPLPPANLLA